MKLLTLGSSWTCRWTSQLHRRTGPAVFKVWRWTGPKQLWTLGHVQDTEHVHVCLLKARDLNRMISLCSFWGGQNLELFGADWETFDGVAQEPFGLQVPQVHCPLCCSGSCEVHHEATGTMSTMWSRPVWINGSVWWKSRGNKPQ